MKTMTCNELGGACDLEFHANSFDEIAELSQQHGQEMAEKSDSAHLEAMEEMVKLMQQPGKLQQWMKDKEDEFNNLEED